MSVLPSSALQTWAVHVAWCCLGHPLRGGVSIDVVLMCQRCAQGHPQQLLGPLKALSKDKQLKVDI